MDTTDELLVENLLADLVKIGQVGATPTRLPELTQLWNLAIVGVAAPGTKTIDRALGVIAVLKEAADELGEGPSGDAVRLYLGLASRSRGLRQRDRRELAADAIDIDRETWRKYWEKPLLNELAIEIYRMEYERRIRVRVRPTRRPEGTALHDLSASGGKTLDKREAEARLFATAYALRADLLSAEMASGTDEDRRTEFLDTALWRYAILAEAMARYIDRYGSALVMAGNEVTVNEITSLLGYRAPFTDEQIVTLRLALAGAPKRDEFLEGDGVANLRSFWVLES